MGASGQSPSSACGRRQLPALPAGFRKRAFYPACYGADHLLLFVGKKEKGGDEVTTIQHIITILSVVLGTMITRFLPFLIFPEGKTPPAFITYLGTVLPYAVIGLLVVYCLKDAVFAAYHGLPELIAIVFLSILHKWKKNTFLSIGAGTVLYMVLVQTCFR